MFHGGSGWWSFIRYDETQAGPKVDRQLLKRVAGWIRPHSGRIALMLLLLLAIALIELVPPLIYGGLINGLADGSLELSTLNWMALGLLLIPTLSTLLGTGQRYLSAFIGERLIFDLRVSMYAHMQRMGLRFFTETKTGDIISRFASDVVGAQSAVTNTIPNLLTNVLTLVTTLAIMLHLEWRLTLVALVALPLFLLPTRRVAHVLRRIRREGAGYDARMSSQIQETLNVSGALLVRSFGRGAGEVARFSEAAGAVRDIGVRRAVVGRWFFTGLGIATALGTALMYWVGGYLVLQAPPDGSGLAPGDLVTFAAYVARLYGPVSGLSNLQVEFMTSLVSFERVFEYLDLPVEIAEPEEPLQLETVEGRLAFEDVSFGYHHLPPVVAAAREARAALGRTTEVDPTSPPPSHPAHHSMPAGHPPKNIEEPQVAASEKVAASEAKNGHGERGSGSNLTQNSQVAGDSQDKENSRDAGHRQDPDQPGPWALAGLNFEAAPGSLVALVGPSGAGKTTVSYLVARLYDPTQGRILLDGHDLRDLGLDTVTQHVGMVTQESYLFHDTIRANLSFGRPEARQTEIEAACRAANIHERITELQEGYETVVGERGYRLSGGEKQRLALARVILKDPSIIVLDEATSHLDSQNEALIQDALERVMQGRTSLVIAHRLSTILAADLILVLEAGRIVERGTHAELLEQGGLYAELFETQFHQAEPAA